MEDDDRRTATFGIATRRKDERMVRRKTEEVSTLVDSAFTLRVTAELFHQISTSTKILFASQFNKFEVRYVFFGVREDEESG